MQKQTPSVGRQIHVCFSGRRLPATIIFVHNDQTVDASILGLGGVTQESSLSYAEEPTPAEGEDTRNSMRTPHLSWSWPPFVPAVKPPADKL